MRSEKDVLTEAVTTNTIWGMNLLILEVLLDIRSLLKGDFLK